MIHNLLDECITNITIVGNELYIMLDNDISYKVHHIKDYIENIFLQPIDFIIEDLIGMDIRKISISHEILDNDDILSILNINDKLFKFYGNYDSRRMFTNCYNIEITKI